MIINGKDLTEEILEKLKKERAKLQKLTLASFLIGKTPEKEKFLEIKKKFAEKLNIEFRTYNIDQSWHRKKIRSYIHEVIKHPTIQGALIQLPLPPNLPTQYFLNSIPPEKDVDCLSSRSLGLYYTDRGIIRPPAVEVVDFLKQRFNLKFEGKIVLIAGYGHLTGKPLTHYFANEKSTVIVTNEKTSNPEEFYRQADVIVSGVGKPNLIKECKKGAVIIDFGYSVITRPAPEQSTVRGSPESVLRTGSGRTDADDTPTIAGDVDVENLKDKACIITPTPNGTGPILVAKLFENFIKLASLSLSAN
jgi:methylenetetrahydrofolate dehydrogenase (NADP+)/methenyltetrahydrofolate cyclohydrolase